MKSLIALVLAVAMTPCAFAEEQKPVAPTKKDCPLCKLPGRAALFAGVAKACPAGCEKLCCSGTEATYVVLDMKCEGCENEIRSALAKNAGVLVEAVCHKSGHAVVKYDATKVQSAKLVAAIVASGYKVAGQVASFKVTGLQDDNAASAVEKVLVGIDGVSKIETVCQKSGAATVTFDPTATTRDKIAQAINTTKYKVAKDR